MHSHIAGSKVISDVVSGPSCAAMVSTLLRRLMPCWFVGRGSDTYATGYKYAGLGYTTVFDAAVAPLLARVAHHDLQETPIIDKGCFS